jgi:hypothetical protein
MTNAGASPSAVEGRSGVNPSTVEGATVMIGIVDAAIAAAIFVALTAVTGATYHLIPAADRLRAGQPAAFAR